MPDADTRHLTTTRPPRAKKPHTPKTALTPATHGHGHPHLPPSHLETATRHDLQPPHCTTTGRTIITTRRFTNATPTGPYTRPAKPPSCEAHLATRGSPAGTGTLGHLPSTSSAPTSDRSEPRIQPRRPRHDRRAQTTHGHATKTSHDHNDSSGRRPDDYDDSGGRTSDDVEASPTTHDVARTSFRKDTDAMPRLHHGGPEECATPDDRATYQVPGSAERPRRHRHHRRPHGRHVELGRENEEEHSEPYLVDCAG